MRVIKFFDSIEKHIRIKIELLDSPLTFARKKKRFIDIVSSLFLSHPRINSSRFHFVFFNLIEISFDRRLLSFTINERARLTGEENFLSANPNIYARPTRTAVGFTLLLLVIFFHKTAKIHFFFFFRDLFLHIVVYMRWKKKREREEQDRKGNGKKGERENEVEICIEMTGAGFNEKYMSAPRGNFVIEVSCKIHASRVLANVSD